MTHPSWHNYLKPDEKEALASFELEITRLRKDAAANSRWRKMIMDRAMARERAALKLGTSK